MKMIIGSFEWILVVVRETCWLRISLKGMQFFYPRYLVREGMPTHQARLRASNHNFVPGHVSIQEIMIFIYLGTIKN